MPQLDSLTYFGQVFITAIILILFFILTTSVVLPNLFKILKTRRFFLDRLSLSSDLYSECLFQLFFLKNSSVTKSVTCLNENIDSLLFELKNVELMDEQLNLLDELELETLQLNFELFSCSTNLNDVFF